MDYFIRWQITKQEAVKFKTQEDVILYFLIPLVEKKEFFEKVTNFYITKINYTTVRLQVFVNHNFLESLQEIVESAISSLFVVDKEGPTQGLIVYEDYAPSDREMDFREYLEDITRIGLDLHKSDLISAKNFAVKSRFISKPIGNLHPKDVLGEHFHGFSKYYRLLEKDSLKINNFWDRFCENYPECTPWDHFYYNIILGLDISPGMSYENFAKEAGTSIDKDFLERLRK